jgi:hypothetical protein
VNEINADIVEKLLKLAENKFRNGVSEKWTHQDFLDLSSEIFNYTNENISASTLKRLFGKVNSESLPRKTSLDILAKYIGYKNWIYFRNKHLPKKKNVTTFCNFKMFILALIIGIVFVFFVFRNSLIESYNKRQDFVFEVQNSIGEAPHSLKVNIDVTNLIGNNFFFLQPMGDAKIFVSNKDSVYDIFIKKPGIKPLRFYQNNTLLKETKIYTETKEGDAAISTDHRDIYLPQDSLLNDSTLALNSNLLIENSLFSGFNSVKYSYGRVSNINLDTFVLETRFRYQKVSGYEECTRTYFTFNGTKEFISIPLAHPSCLKGMIFYIEDKEIPSVNNPKEFGGNIEDWQVTKISKQGNSIYVFRNDTEIYTGEVNLDWGTFFMINYKFFGNGEIDYVRLFDGDNKLVFGEEF